MTPEERDALKKGDIIYDLDGKPREVKGIPSGRAEYPEWRMQSLWSAYEKVGPMNMLTQYGSTPRGAIEQQIENCEQRAAIARTAADNWEHAAAEARERLAAL